MAPTTLQAEIKKRRPFESPEQEAHLNLMRTQSRLAAQTEQMLRQFGTTGPQYNVLRILRGAKMGGDDALPCLEVAQRMIAQVPDITRLIDRLEAGGLVRRGRTKQDRRVVLVSITAEGLALLAKIDRPNIELHKAQLGHMTRSELMTLSRLLVKARNGPDSVDA